jgi:lipopolysaccharide exporter
LRLLTVVGGLSLAIGLLRRVLPEVSLMDVIRTIARPLLAAAAMAAALFAVGNILALPLAGMLILKIGVGLLVYSLSILLMWRVSGKPDGAESYVLAASMRVLRRA